MASCCDPRVYASFFDEADARKQARAYRRRGLDPTARRIVLERGA